MAKLGALLMADVSSDPLHIVLDYCHTGRKSLLVLS